MTQTRLLDHYYAGSWKCPKGDDGLGVVNPATHENVAHVPLGSREDVDAAVSAAAAAFPSWRRTPPEDRIQYLFKLKRLLEDHIEELARICTIENGKTLGESRAELRRAIENVVRNAMFYTSPGTKVEIALASPDGRTAELEIRDHGPGVPEAALQHLFEPFYRVDQARARKTGGAGVGLSICERAVRLHGGKVSARNASPRGLSVEISLPLAVAPQLAAPKAEVISPRVPAIVEAPI